jgi:hypothetical protein
MTLAEVYTEGIVKVATGRISIATMRKVIADPYIKLPIGFYKECRSKGIRLHTKHCGVDHNAERMYQ